MRPDKRLSDQLRPLTFDRGWQRNPAGSCLVSMGNTRVLCSASIDPKPPRWLQGTGRGWVSAEYDMLPGSTDTRKRRSVSKGRPDGRATEIQRLIGRSLRAAVDLEALGPRMIWVDCDVLQADAGTRTAAINGGFVALTEALLSLVVSGAIDSIPLHSSVSAVSAVLGSAGMALDPVYEEDAGADVDMNFVFTGDGRLVEVQGCAEGEPFAPTALSELLQLSQAGCAEITRLQQQALPEIDWSAGRPVLRDGTS